MNDSRDGPTHPAVPIWRTITLGLTLLGVGAALPAAPIRTRHPLVAARAEPTAEAYFTRALRDQRRQVEIAPALRLLRAPDGLLPDTALVRYLRWRRGLSPAQFDRWHPRVGAMMLRDEQLRRPPVLPPTLPPILPRCDCPPIPVRPLAPQGTTIPEPAPLLMAIVLAGSVALSRRRVLGQGPRRGRPAA